MMESQAQSTNTQVQPKVRVGAVIRDVFIIVVLTAVMGAIAAAMAGPDSQRGVVAVGMSNLIFGTIGFVMSGALAKGNRWRHLAWVAFGVWLAELINVFLSGFPITEWLRSIPVVLIMMGVGGGLSYLFRKGRF